MSIYDRFHGGDSITSESNKEKERMLIKGVFFVAVFSAMVFLGN